MLCGELGLYVAHAFSLWQDNNISSNVTQYVAMPVGIIKGALARMGYQATVTTEIVQLPQCKLSVKDIYSLL